MVDATFKDIQEYRCIFSLIHSHETNGRGGLPFPFLKIKSAVILKKQVLIVSIFGLNFPLIMQFKSVEKKKLPNISVGVFFLCFWRNVNRSVIVPRTLPCSEKFPVARQHSFIILSAKRYNLHVQQCSVYAYVSITGQ